MKIQSEALTEVQPLLGRTKVSGLLIAYDTQGTGEMLLLKHLEFKLCSYASLSDAAVTLILEGLV